MTLPASAQHANARERRQALLDAEEYIRAHIWRLEDDSTNALYAMYMQAYRTMLDALESVWRNSVQADAWTASDAKFQARLNTLMGAIENEVQRLGKNSSDFALEQAAASFRVGYFGRAYTLTRGLRGGVSEMPRLPTEAIRAQLLLPYEGGTFLTRFEDARDEFVARIRRSLIQSQINGESIRDAQKRIAEALGIDIGRRTKAARQANEGLFSKTEMIARTEILRASNLGADTIYRANNDIIEGWIWLLTQDERTCEICIDLNDDDHIYEFGEIGLPPTESHPNCRCTPIPVLKDRALEQEITGPTQTYNEWARENGVGQSDDGGMFDSPGAPPPSTEEE